MIVGGATDSGEPYGPSWRHLRSVETLNENQHLTCNIPSYPMTIVYHASTVTSTGILVCGGLSNDLNGYSRDCYEYSSNNWKKMPSMTTKRGYFDMIYLKGKVYAVGGDGNSGSRSSMDIFDSTTRTWTKQSMPFSVYGHCISQLSANQFILIAGYNGGVSINVM